MTDAPETDRPSWRRAFLDALTQRRATFLARLPRRLKLGVLAGLLVLGGASLWLLPPGAGGQGGAGEQGGVPAKGALSSLSSTPLADMTSRAFRGLQRSGLWPKDKEAEPLTPPPAAPEKEVVEEQAAAPAPSSPLEAEARAANDLEGAGGGLSPAPDPGLAETTPQGVLPKIGSDGRQPWQVYAHPFNEADRRPRVAIVVVDLGLSRFATDAALLRMPSHVTMAFDAEGADVGAWLLRARQDGHETLLSVPMEPLDYPRSDPGPNTLLTNLSTADNLARLSWSLGRGTGYVGVTTMTGSRFSAEPSKLRPILEALHQRGLLAMDPGLAPHTTIENEAGLLGMRLAHATMRLDANPTPAAIDESLRQLEKTARLSGRAVGLISPLPVSLDRTKAWISGLAARGIVLAPLSAVTE